MVSVQIIGYICRALAHDDKNSVPIYSIQTIMILLAPPLYAASIYMTLGRLILYLDVESLSPIPTKWLTAIFVTGDVIAFVMQAAGMSLALDPSPVVRTIQSITFSDITAGGGIMASGTVSAMNTGEHITIGGLCVQLVFFSVFIIVATIVHWRVHRNPTRKSLVASIKNWKRTSWETIMVVLYVASILILVRSIFRLIEYAQGNSGYLISHEVFMYVFDSTLMFFTMLVMSIYHPSKILNSTAKSEHVSMETYETRTQLRQIPSA